MHSIWWVGLDVHKKFIQVAMFKDQSAEPDAEWTVAKPDRRAVKRLARKMVRLADGGEVRCCYEAGPAGFSVKRWLEDEAPPLVCEVIAPALIPIKPGERIKTDRRDAQKLGIRCTNPVFRGA
jgi:transposase